MQFAQLHYLACADVSFAIRYVDGCMLTGMLKRATRGMMRCIEDDGSSGRIFLSFAEKLDFRPGTWDLVSVGHFRCRAAALRSATKEGSRYLSTRVGITVLRKHPLVLCGGSAIRDHTFTVAQLQRRRAVPDRWILLPDRVSAGSSRSCRSKRCYFCLVIVVNRLCLNI